MPVWNNGASICCHKYWGQQQILPWDIQSKWYAHSTGSTQTSTAVDVAGHSSLHFESMLCGSDYIHSKGLPHQLFQWWTILNEIRCSGSWKWGWDLARCWPGVILNELGHGGSCDRKQDYIAIFAPSELAFWSRDPPGTSSLRMTSGEYSAQFCCQFCYLMWPPSWIFSRMVLFRESVFVVVFSHSEPDPPFFDVE